NRFDSRMDRCNRREGCSLWRTWRTCNCLW
ncbi:unnamed protein product, partial [Allacma fusca]